MIASRSLPRRALAGFACASLALCLVLAASGSGLQACSIAVSDLLAAADRRPLLLSLRDTVLIPRSRRFMEETAALEAAAARLALAPSEVSLDSAKTAWKKAALAWAALQATRLGPIAVLTPHVDFWPTRPNLIEQGLAAADPLDSIRLAALTPSAAKGLPALEWLLFARPSDSTLAGLENQASGPRRREYVVAVASDLRRVAVANLAEWKGVMGAAFAGSASDLRFPSTQMAVEQLLKGLVASLEEMKNAKILAPAGSKSSGRPQPDAVEAPYAGISLEILRANLDGVEAAFTGAGGTGLNAYMESLGSDLPGHLAAEIAKTRAALAAVNPPLSAAVTGQPAQVAALGAALGDLVVAVKNDVASTLGFNITFTDNDGD
jgi:predicted lipoprotein